MHSWSVSLAVPGWELRRCRNASYCVLLWTQGLLHPDCQDCVFTGSDPILPLEWWELLVDRVVNSIQLSLIILGISFFVVEDPNHFMFNLPKISHKLSKSYLNIFVYLSMKTTFGSYLSLVFWMTFDCTGFLHGWSESSFLCNQRKKKLRRILQVENISSSIA